jgi:hypothetical protein
MAEHENSIKDLQEYFGVDAKEMRELWMSLTDSEKAEWKTADLS